MNIDVHWHYIPQAVRERMTAGGAIMQDVPLLYDTDLQIAEMNRRRIDVAAVAPSTSVFQYHLSTDDALPIHQLFNDSLADFVEEHPDRCVGLGTVPMQDPQAAVQELKRAMQVKGLRGVSIGTNVNGRNLDEAEFRPFFRAASELGAFVFVHPVNVLAGDRLKRYHLGNLIGNPTETAVTIASLIFGGVYDDCPDLVCCFSHGGGSFPALVGRWRHGYSVREEAKVFGARSPEEYLPRIYIDSLVHDESVCSHAINILGTDHMMLGTDMPWDMGADDPVDRIEQMSSLSNAEREQICGGTAARLLGLST